MSGFLTVAESNECRLILGLPTISTEAPSAPVVDVAVGPCPSLAPGDCSQAGAA